MFHFLLNDRFLGFSWPVGQERKGRDFSLLLREVTFIHKDEFSHPQVLRAVQDFWPRSSVLRHSSWKEKF